MIKSFRDRDTARVFEGKSVRKFQSFQRVARRRLFQLAAATALLDLKGAAFSLEKLKGDRRGQHSIRINDQWRVCFVWKDDNAHNVEITDYH
ncbi:MAG TPA: type II toxin-antitoxin system RelE/ParE family toxin [Candidatus Baltobacteraceae bacterium]|nr:type II toxin-antitoxin system RelE/ParE family toxin [Candidatus Baltobacteraceae bacterium]